MQNRVSFEDFKVVMKGLVAAYPQQKFMVDEYSYNLWYTALQDIPYPTLNKAATNYIMTHRFPPTIADLRELSYRLSNSAPMLAPNAWNQLIRALRQAYAPNSEDIWDQLPDITKQIVGGYSTFRQWGNTSLETLEGVQRPMFIKRFEEYQRREMTAAITPASVRPPQPALPETPKHEQIEQKKEGGGVEAPADMMKALRERLNNGKNKA